MSYSVSGTCLCGDISYEINGHMSVFQYCHCSRCRKVTGSAHASNLFVKPEQFKWTSGEDQVVYFSPDDAKYFATNFCRKCGSNLPWLSKSGKVVIVPAGTMDSDPDVRPVQNIFCASAGDWYVNPDTLPQYDVLPPKK